MYGTVREVIRVKRTGQVVFGSLGEAQINQCAKTHLDVVHWIFTEALKVLLVLTWASVLSSTHGSWGMVIVKFQLLNLEVHLL